MKLTTARLKRLIKEELEAVMQEDDSPMGAGDWTTSDAQLAKDNPLTIEMWKGYNYEDKPTTWRKEETEDGNRYTPEKNNKQMELEFND